MGTRDLSSDLHHPFSKATNFIDFKRLILRSASPFYQSNKFHWLDVNLTSESAWPADIAGFFAQYPQQIKGFVFFILFFIDRIWLSNMWRDWKSILVRVWIYHKGDNERWVNFIKDLEKKKKGRYHLIRSIWCINQSVKDLKDSIKYWIWKIQLRLENISKGLFSMIFENIVFLVWYLLISLRWWLILKIVTYFLWLYMWSCSIESKEYELMFGWVKYCTSIL